LNARLASQASQKFDKWEQMLPVLPGTADPYLVGVLHVCGNGKHERALMTKFLAILGLLALALTGGVATLSTLISPP
jgi:hypothetical protein